MRPAFRNAYLKLSRSLNPNPKFPYTLSFLHTFPTISTSQSPTFINSRIGRETFRSLSSTLCSSSMAGGEAHAPHSSASLEKQFENFHVQLEESGSLRDRIRAVVMEIESTTRLMHATLLLVHQSRPTPGISIIYLGFFFFVNWWNDCLWEEEKTMKSRPFPVTGTKLSVI